MRTWSGYVLDADLQEARRVGKIRLPDQIWQGKESKGKPMSRTPPPPQVLTVAQVDLGPIRELLSRYGLRCELTGAAAPIPGSFWGESEAGLIGDRVWLRPDTPVHSLLHEACHYICMSRARRDRLHTDAGGDYAEENAVCYLQLLLAAEIEDVGVQRLLSDMDAWGYSFRLGSAAAWFAEDAADARQWLFDQGLIDAQRRPTYRLRQA